MKEKKLHIPGIELEERISSQVDMHVFRGKVGEDAEDKVIKVAEYTSGSTENIVKLEHEYQVIRELNINGVPGCYGLLYFDKGVALVLQDMGKNTIFGELQKRGSLDPVTGLRLGLKLIELIGAVHDRKIIHKDINPSNITFSTDVTECALIDFCKATPFSRERSNFRALPSIEGTLAYMAPEQTGRMNREMDYRTDFYAFGVTLYQVLTGRLPFESDDPLTLLHAHLAILPPPAHERNPQLPAFVSEVLAKLLAKSAGDRYQTVEGIQRDLQTCLDKIRSGETGRFKLGVADETGVFHIPQKLYGRETEKELVIDSFRAVESGGSGVLFVGGLSGIGKTALVRETHPEISRCGGLYCEGKFDQLGRNTPYSALVQACNRLLEQTLLSESAKTAYWQGKLVDALGHNGQIMVDVLPVLQPFVVCEPIEELGPLETQNRFNYVFTRFLKIFCRAEQPVVLFLDDLQWMDLSTLRLLNHLVSGAELDHFLLVGCFRSNELHETHRYAI